VRGKRAGTARGGDYAMGMRGPRAQGTTVADMLVLIGLALVGAAIYFAFGMAATLAYAGVLLTVIGLALANQRDWDRVK